MKKFAAFLFALFAALSLASPCDAASPVRFHVLSVSFANGSAVVKGEILNETAGPVCIGNAEIVAVINDADGNALIDDTYQFYGLGIIIPANDVDPCTFTISGEAPRAYDGRIQWRIQSRLKWTEA